MSRKILKGCFGGCTYYLLELIWNGHSHWTMFILGGICFRLLSYIRNFNTSLPVKCLMGGVSITLAELLAGVFLNITLKVGVWDYSTLPFNLFGQICLPFTLIWIILSLPAIKIDELLDKQLKTA